MASLRNTPLTWVVVLLVLGALVTVAPVAVPLILAAWVAMLSRPMLERLARVLKSRRLAASALTVLLLLFVVAPVGLVVIGVVSGAGELWGLVENSEGAPSAFRALVSPGSTAGSFELPTRPEDVAVWVRRYGTQLFQLVGGIAGTATRVVFGLLVFFLAVWTFLLEGPAFYTAAELHLPLRPSEVRRFADAFNETGRGLLISVGLTSASQALAAMAIYFALGVPRALALGLVTGLATFIPVLGAGLVWAPVAAGLYLTDHPVKAVVMAVLGIGVISTMDNVLRPFFSRYGKLNLSLLTLIVAVFGGLAAFGPFGALIGPLVIRLAAEGLSLMRERRDAEAARRAVPGLPP